MITATPSVPLSAGPFIVPPFERESGGVDFLGLRQVNLDLMAECFPGINNTTQHIRPFSVLSWVHWRFHAELARSGAREASSKEITLFQEKAEVLFTWGHQLAGIGIPGRLSKCPESSAGWVELSFKAWQRSPRNTSLQAPVQYGPAMKSRFGLGFAEPVADGLYSVTESGEGLAEALDGRLQRTSAYDLICDLSPRKGRRADAEALFPAWRVDAPSKAEAKIFLPAYFDDTDFENGSSIAVRSGTIQAVREVLRAAGRGMTEDAIRSSLAYRRLPSGRKITLSHAPALNAHKWFILQVRQAQRAALEGLLAWLEWRMGSLPRIEMVRAELVRIVGREGKITCKETLARFIESTGDMDRYLTLAAKGGPDCIFDLVTRLFDSIDEDVNQAVPIAGRLLLVTSALTNWLLLGDQSQPFLNKGGAERVSLTHQLRHFTSRGDLAFGEWLCEVVETWVIGQHLKFATYRFDGGTQRLRFTFDEDGLEFLAEKPSFPILSRDHLAAALSLMAECGLVKFDLTEGAFSA
ncbi:hypothetical protein [Oleiharenicola lentus]|uniref:hypothetical protein n=1 Tax=Oleiharenicola lentus TaxID=2508720 RepID=UPI003F6618A3